MRGNINNKIIYFIIFVGIFLKVAYIIQFNDYYDDWNFFYTVDPHISNAETWQRHYFGDRGDHILKEAFPWNFTYFTKYILKVIGYTIESTHYFLLSFSILSFFMFHKICNLINKDLKFTILALILFATNLFLIRESNSFRPHSLSILLSLINSYFFILIFIRNKIKKKLLFSYIISTLLLLSFWPQNLAIFAGHCVFLFILFIKKKSNILLYLLTPALIFLLYIFLNYKYIEYIAFQDWSYTQFDLKFFINYFFRSFFGSIIFGGFMLVIFAFFLIKDIKINIKALKKKSLFKLPFLKLDEESFIIINILTVYLFIISYSLLKESVMAPKYFLVLLPLIIIWLSLKISKIKITLLYSLVLTFSILNSIYYWNDTPIKRPPLVKLLKIINSSDIKKIYTTESTVFNNYLSHYKLATINHIKVEKFEDMKQNTSYDKVAFVCMNYPRSSYGESYKNLIHINCKNLSISLENKIKNNTIIELKKILITDFIIFIVKYKS
jgi:hypothetical protein